MPRGIRTDTRLARSGGLGTPLTMKLVPQLVLAVCAPLLAAPALGAPSYHISFERSGYGAQYSVTQSTPFQHADAYGVPASSAIFAGSGFAYPGHVGIDNRVEMYWPGGSGSARYDVYSSATANDFVIAGPAGPQVTGELHLRIRASLARAGGFEGNAGHGARLNVDARAKLGQLVAMGDLYSTNYDTHGTGVLAGLSSPDVDFPFVLSGTFPVGTPFDVYIRVFGIETVYGNSSSTPNPGYARTDAGSNSVYGLFLEEVSGQVMSLPAGYTLNSASWGVVDNHFQSTVGVEPEPGHDALRLSAHPNPSTGASIVSFDQPQAAHVRLQVFDVGGRLVRTLADEWHAEGPHQFQWDGHTDDGDIAGTGLYFLRVEAGGETATRQIVRVQAWSW